MNDAVKDMPSAFREAIGMRTVEMQPDEAMVDRHALARGVCYGPRPGKIPMERRQVHDGRQ